MKPSYEQTIIDLVTSGQGEGQPAKPAAEVRDNVFNYLASFVNAHDDVGTLPISSTIRSAQGPFFSPQDVLRYLGQGTLLIEDELGQSVINGIVNVVRRYDDYWEAEVYDVYIEEESQ